MPTDEKNSLYGCLALIIIMGLVVFTFYMIGWSIAWIFYFIGWLFPMPF
jgi:hypothetical protein